MNSDLTTKELGVFQAVMNRYNNQRLPLLLKMKEKVDQGGVLSDRELSLLKEAIAEAKSGESFAAKHPQYQTLIDEAQNLYHHITEKALENEKSNS